MSKAIKFILGTIVLGLITSFIYDAVKNFPFLSSVWNILKWIWKTIFEFEFRLWKIILGVFVFYLARKIIKKSRNKVASKPKFHSYKTDEFHLINWKWDWAFNYKSKFWYPNNIKPVCPKCDTPMHYEYMYGSYEGKCPRCGNHILNLKPDRDIKALIIDNIDRGLIK